MAFTKSLLPMLPEELSAKKIILASKSPRRQFLLKECGIPFVLRTKEVDESFSSDLKEEQIPLYLCKKKAEAFAPDIDDDSMVITADTIVWINGHVLNKPENAEEAFLMLQEMSGKKHEVFTGVCLYTHQKEVVFSVRSEVFFKALPDELIREYIAEKKPFDKAGSYGAQECLQPGFNPCSEEENEFLRSIGKQEMLQDCLPASGVANPYVIVDDIEGSYFNVMGLPVKELWDEIRKF